MTNPEIEFRRQYRTQWADFLASPMGIAFQNVLINRLPPPQPSDHPHHESGKLGEIRHWYQMFNLIRNELSQPLSDASREVPQDYNATIGKADEAATNQP